MVDVGHREEEAVVVEEEVGDKYHFVLFPHVFVQECVE